MASVTAETELQATQTHTSWPEIERERGGIKGLEASGRGSWSCHIKDK